jgi:hypothetical protein
MEINLRIKFGTHFSVDALSYFGLFPVHCVATYRQVTFPFSEWLWNKFLTVSEESSTKEFEVKLLWNLSVALNTELSLILLSECFQNIRCSKRNTASLPVRSEFCAYCRMLKSYLTDRPFQVKFKGEITIWRKTEAGVPQGSVLHRIRPISYLHKRPHDIRQHNNCYLHQCYSNLSHTWRSSDSLNETSSHHQWDRRLGKEMEN